MMTEGGTETIMRPPIFCKQQKLWNFGRWTGEGKSENEDNALMRRRKGRNNGNNGTKQYGRSSALYSGSNTSTTESKKSTTTSKNFSRSMSPPWINMPLRQWNASLINGRSTAKPTAITETRKTTTMITSYVGWREDLGFWERFYNCLERELSPGGCGLRIMYLQM